MVGTIGSARIVHNEGVDSQVKGLIKKLEKFKLEFKKHVDLFNSQSRLYAKICKYKEAIDVIDTFLDNIDYDKLSIKQKKVFQIDTFLFNKACYNALLAEQKNSELHKGMALDLLKEAILLDGDSIEDAKKDKDFEFIRNNYPEDFEKALKI